MKASKLRTNNGKLTNRNLREKLLLVLANRDIDESKGDYKFGQYIMNRFKKLSKAGKNSEGKIDTLVKWFKSFYLDN